MFSPPIPVPGVRIALPRAFSEDTFELIANWGFNFVRVPMSYWYWARPSEWAPMSEEILERIDRAVLLGQKYGLHVSLAMHRAPGYCVNPPTEPLSLWSNDRALKATCDYWSTLAKRYKYISSRRLSFDLLHEPPYPSDAAYNLFYSTLGQGLGEAKPMTYADHARYVESATKVIRQHSSERLVIAEGVGWGTTPDTNLESLGIAHSFHCYEPVGVAQSRSPAMGKGIPWDQVPLPSWPHGWNLNQEFWTAEDLKQFFSPYTQLARSGKLVHCGEIGCYNKTPHQVTLDWLEAALSSFTGQGIGFAMWQLEGEYGLVNSGRTDVAYVTMRDGRRLDQSMLKLLQKY